MAWNFEEIKNKIADEIGRASSLPEAEDLRIKYLGRKGLFVEMYASLAQASAEEKPSLGKNINVLKGWTAALLEEKTKEIVRQEKEKSRVALDVTLPGVWQERGRKHVLTQTIEEICSIFENLGFVVEEGPEVDSEFNNFDALNIPPEHPSRDGFDTFYVDQPDPGDKNRHLLLRSQTSSVQIRVMKKNKPPLAVVVPGKVYRPDAVDASHSFMFHQIEGLLVDRDVRFSDLKGLITEFLKRLFTPDIRMRFRPHFFPFTEPSAEVDISCYICKGKGCSVCKQNGWLEIMGCGMVHPHVFDAAGYPRGKYTGLAFGLGVERLTMLKYGIHDIRLFFENDMRFLKQF